MSVRFKVIIVQPRYQVNLGYMARVSKNFGVKRLFLVKPRTKIGGRAIMFAKHARDLLLNAKVYKDLDSALAGCDAVMGTTGIWSKGKSGFRGAMLVEDALLDLSRLRGRKTVAVLIGRDDTGLTKEEIDRCDLVAHIATSPDYPVLNISHALGIMLYLMESRGFRPATAEPRAQKAESKEIEYLFSAFGRMTEKKKIRNRKAVRGAFKRLVYASQPSRQEVHALITALK